MKLYILKQDSSNLYYITTTNHITKLCSMLNKYNAEDIIKYRDYSIDDEFYNKAINSGITFLNTPSLMDYFNHFYGKYKYKNSETWYKIPPEILPNITEYIESLKEPKNDTTKIAPKAHGTYKCVKCNKILSSLTYFNRHIESCSGLKCPTCNAIFTNKVNYKTHIENCGYFTCTKCKREFRSKLKFNKHVALCGKAKILKKPKIIKEEPTHVIDFN